MEKYFVVLFLCMFFSFNSSSEERKNINGTVSHITPVTSTDFSVLKNQKVYYAGGNSGRQYEQVDFLKPVPGKEFEKCNIEIGTEITLLGEEHFFEDIPVLLARISDPNLKGRGYSRLCGFQSYIFVQEKFLSLTRPVFTSHDHYDDYTLFNAHPFSTGQIVYLKLKTLSSFSRATIKNAEHWFHPERDIAYINHCIVLPEPRLQIQGFSQDENTVLLEVLDDGKSGASCQKGHEIVLPVEDIEFSYSKEDICKTIYSYRKERNQCILQPFSSVRLLENIDKIFGNVDIESLNEMDSSLTGALSMYVGIGISPLINYAKHRVWTFNKVKEFLAWLAWPSSNMTDSPSREALTAVNAIFKADTGDDRVTAYLLQTLLEKGLNFPRTGFRTPEDLVNAFNQVIYESKDAQGKAHSYTFLDLVQKSRNKGVWQWIHFFMEQGLCEEVDDEDGGLMKPCETEEDCPHFFIREELCILRTYCTLSKTMSVEAADSLAEFDYFKEFTDYVVSNEINKSHWSRQDIQSSKDLIWYKDLCGNPVQ